MGNVEMLKLYHGIRSYEVPKWNIISEIFRIIFSLKCGMSKHKYTHILDISERVIVA